MELDLTEAIEAAYDQLRDLTDDHLYPPGFDLMVGRAIEVIAPILERQVREKIAQEIEASSILDDEERYASCTCLAGVECRPHACHRVMNGVHADEDTWPVHVKIGVWRGLDPLIRNHAAAIARGSSPSSSTEEKGQR